MYATGVEIHIRGILFSQIPTSNFRHTSIIYITTGIQNETILNNTNYTCVCKLSFSTKRDSQKQ